MKLRLHGERGGISVEFETEEQLPLDNLWIEVIRSNGEREYVGSIYFQPLDDGSIRLSLGRVNDDASDWWEEEQGIIISSETEQETEKQ